jgi:hypothetical protein
MLADHAASYSCGHKAQVGVSLWRLRGAQAQRIDFSFAVRWAHRRSREWADRLAPGRRNE